MIKLLFSEGTEDKAQSTKHKKLLSMDHLLLYCLAGGIALVFIVVAARIAVRWVVRIALVGLLLSAVGGAAWWWLNQRNHQPETRPRPVITTRRASSDRR